MTAPQRTSPCKYYNPDTGYCTNTHAPAIGTSVSRAFCMVTCSLYEERPVLRSCIKCCNYDAVGKICLTKADGITIFDPNMQRAYCQQFIAINPVIQKRIPYNTQTKHVYFSLDVIEEIRYLITDNTHFDSDNWSEYDADILQGAANTIMERIKAKKQDTKVEKKRVLMTFDEGEQL